MEPLAALGLVGNIITLIDFSSKLINAASSARHSASGLPEDLQDAAIITKNLESFLTQLPAPTLPPTASAADKALAELTANCRNTCDQLNELVKEIRGKGPGSRRDSLRIAAKGLWHKDKLQELEKRLDSHRSQIMDHFHRIFQEEQSTKLRTLVDSQAGMAGNLADEMRKQLNETEDKILHMVKSATASSASVTNTLLRDICDQLVELSTQTKAFNAEQEILNLLWFPELRSRKNAVEEAHEGTYRWLLYDPESDSESGSLSGSEYAHLSFLSGFGHVSTEEADLRENEEKGIWRKRFIKWLQTEEDRGSFFISGKPGSGKSTLMKYISQDTHTRRLLEAWAAHDGKQLLLLSFYFWISGTRIQKSIEGLYRSMLWEILQQAPELIETTFPTLFRKASAGPLHESDLDSSNLANMFQDVLENAVLLRKYRICFFIDGLDEYGGDHWKLAKILKSWCLSPAFKLCVSSRPHTEFINNFGQPGPWLKLHELTRGDIRRVVRDQFATDERVTDRQQRSSEFQQLMQSLVEKAEGVFIWVVLTMRSLLSGIGSYASMAQLQKRLDAIPAKLTAMFRYIFDGIDEPDREAAARLFLTLNLQLDLGVQLLGTVQLPLHSSVYIHSLLDDLHDSPSYEKSLMDGTLGPPIYLEEWETRCLAMSHRLIGRCRGLIVFCSLPNNTTPAADYVQLVHRTVGDFLNQPEIKKILQDAAGNFDPFHALSLSLLATLKHTPETTDADALVLAEDAVDATLCLWSDSELSGRGPFLPELTSMTSMFIKLNQKLNPEGQSRPFGDELGRGWVQFTKPITAGKIKTMILTRTIAAEAFATAMEGLKEPGLEETWALVAITIQGYWNHSGPRLADLVSIIAFLLEHKASVNKELPDSCNIWRSSSTPWTLWTRLLWDAAEVMLPRWWRGWEAPPNLEHSLEMLLKYGADPNVCLVGYEVSKDRIQGRMINGNRPSPGELRRLLRGPLRMDLQTIFRTWGFGIDCAHHYGSKEDTNFTYDELQVLRIHTDGAAVLYESSLRDQRYSEVGFIVVKVVARGQMGNLRNAEVEESLQFILSNLREKL